MNGVDTMSNDYTVRPRRKPQPPVRFDDAANGIWCVVVDDTGETSRTWIEKSDGTFEIKMSDAAPSSPRSERFRSARLAHCLFTTLVMNAARMLQILPSTYNLPFWRFTILWRNPWLNLNLTSRSQTPSLSKYR